MAEFAPAYKITEENENGFACDPTDRGGMTWDGIARRKNPNWTGWAIIDKIIISVGLNPNRIDVETKKNPTLQSLKKVFYKKEYWDVNQLDIFTDQDIANEMYDTGVNMGVATAAKFLQEALNLCNRDGVNYADIAIDGIIRLPTPTSGDTIKALRKAEPVAVLNVMNMLQGEKYLKILRSDESQEKYLRGWFKRVVFNSRW